MIRAAALFSGGKDSVYATYIAQQQHFDVCGTLTIVPQRSDSYMFHVPNAGLASVVSGAMGLPSMTVEMSEGEEELEVLGNAIGSLGVDAVITGAIASDYQTSGVNKVCEPLGVKVFSPLWRKEQSPLLKEIVGAGFEVVMVGVAAEGLDESWLGRRIDLGAVGDLEDMSARKRINISGEGGEFETIVLDGPNFRKKLEIVSGRSDWRINAGIFRVNAIRLVDKGLDCRV